MKLIFFLLLIFVAAPAAAADIDTIIKNTLTQSSPSLVDHFDDQVMFQTEDFSDILSATDARVTFLRFLEKGTNWRFQKIHVGNIESGKNHVIFNLSGSAGDFRIFIIYQIIQDAISIEEISIDQY